MLFYKFQLYVNVTQSVLDVHVFFYKMKIMYILKYQISLMNIQIMCILCSPIFLHQRLDVSIVLSTFLFSWIQFRLDLTGNIQIKIETFYYHRKQVIPINFYYNLNKVYNTWHDDIDNSRRCDFYIKKPDFKSIPNVERYL